MAMSLIKDPGPIFKYKMYSYSYSIGAFEHKDLSASNFGISAISGYSIAGCYSWTSGNDNTSVVQISPTTSGTVMQLFRKPNSSSSTTAYISLLWVKNEYMQ